MSGQAFLCAVAVAGFGMTLMACAASRPAPVLPPPSPVVDAPPSRNPVSADLVDAPAAEVLAVLSQAAAEPVLVDALALRAIQCARITLHVRDAVPPDQFARLVVPPLRAQGLQLERTATGWLVRAIGAPRSECSEGAAAASADEGPTAEQARARVMASVRDLSPTEHGIARRELDLALEHLPHVLGAMRIVPTGNPPLLVLADVQPDGLAWRLGMRSGDILLSVMGQTVNNPETALQAYAVARNAKVIVWKVERGGKPIELSLRVED